MGVKDSSQAGLEGVKMKMEEPPTDLKSKYLPGCHTFDHVGSQNLSAHIVIESQDGGQMDSADMNEIVRLSTEMGTNMKVDITVTPGLDH